MSPLSERIEGFASSLECGDGGVRRDFRLALAEVDSLETENVYLRRALKNVRDELSHGATANWEFIEHQFAVLERKQS